MSDEEKKTTTEMTPENPLNITFERALCSRHGELLRATWPSGYAPILIFLFQAVTELEQTWKDAAKLDGRDLDTEDALKELDPHLLEKVFDEKPMCCRVSPRKMLSIYLKLHNEYKFGKKARCEICGKKRQPGNPFRTSSSFHQHVCFNCVLTRLAPLN